MGNAMTELASLSANHSESLPASPLAVLLRANQLLHERVGYELGRGHTISIAELQILGEECKAQARKEQCNER